MHLLQYLVLPLAVLTSSASAMPKKHHVPKTQGCGQPLTNQHVQTLLDNYATIWNTGNFSLVNQTVAPNLVYYQDRIANGTGNGSFIYPINSATQWTQFVTIARTGWRSYNFDVLYSFFGQGRIGVRWTLQAISNGTDAGRNIPAGGLQTFNGTDIYIVNNCSGLIEEVDSAQNYIQEYHNLHIPLGTV